MRYEKDIEEIAHNTERLQGLLLEYTDIRLRLENALCGDEKTVLYADLVKLMIKISDYILESEKSVMKGVSDVMGGKVLELESERLRAEGESLLGDLMTRLFNAGRTSDAELAAKDEEARKRFYREFGMIE